MKTTRHLPAPVAADVSRLHLSRNQRGLVLPRRTAASLTIILVAILAITGTVLHADNELPTPPSGYSWVHCDMIQADLLKPDGWFVTNVPGCFTMSEKPAVQGALVGAQFNVNMNQLPTNNPIDLTTAAFVEQIYAGLTNKTISWKGTTIISTVLSRAQSTNELFRTITSRSRSQGRHDVTVESQWWVNRRTGAAVNIRFEAPTERWDDYWKIARPCFENLRINPAPPSGQSLQRPLAIKPSD